MGKTTFVGTGGKEEDASKEVTQRALSKLCKARPECMDRLRFASEGCCRKSLICIRPVDRARAVALMGIRTHL